MTTSESTILLCSDLDRTLLPNGPQPESPQVRALLRSVAERPEVKLAYVSGRHRELLREAIDSYRLPEPDYAITDVGTRIYTSNAAGHWRVWDAWEAEIGPDWNGMRHDELAGLFADLSPLTLQETEKQNTFKLSYYVALDTEHAALMEDMSLRLAYAGVRANLIWSVDELEHIGLLDVLPASANKLHAIRFLIEALHIPASRTLFAGDSGNDLAVLTSGMRSVLVANAAQDVRETAVQAVRESGHRDSLYLAKGSFFGMNGNYAAGVLEGLAHFFPETAEWLGGKDAIRE
jgi:sucrose-6F-phosphate phosphohydrolase